MDALRIKKILDKDGEMTLTGLPGLKGEEAEVIVIFERGKRMTLGELLESDLVGLWKDREDIGDSVEFARKLRKRVQRRSR